MQKYKAIAVFGSASDAVEPAFREPVFNIGAMLAAQGITMVYGVGDGGLMGESYRGVRSKGGKVLGITIPRLLAAQCADPNIFAEDELIVVDSLHERKRLMTEKSDALLFVPGGWGTMDEISSQGVHAKIGDREVKPMIFLNLNGFWNPMKEMLNNMLKTGSVKPEQIAFVDYADSPAEIFAAIERVEKRLQK